MATYKERVAALKRHGQETKKKHAAAKALRKATQEKRKAARLAEKKKRSAARAEKKAAKKPVDVVKTKGGDYPVYKKKSAKAESFRSKFAKASKAGKKTFKWKGRSYTTEKKKAAPKKAAPKKVATQKPVTPIEAQDAADYAAKGKAKKVAPRNPNRFKEMRDRIDKAAKSIGGKDAWKAPGDKYRTKKQLGGMVKPPSAGSVTPPQPQMDKPAASYKEGGKVESNPYGWPSKDARNGGKK